MEKIKSKSGIKDQAKSSYCMIISNYLASKVWNQVIDGCQGLLENEILTS